MQQAGRQKERGEKKQYKGESCVHQMIHAWRKPTVLVQTAVSMSVLERCWILSTSPS